MSASPELPLRQAEPQASAVGPSSILLVEDDPGDAFLVQELLDDHDPQVEITWVRSMAEAALVVAADTECVLLDLGLPDADGLGALRQMLDLAPHAAVLVLTGLADEHRGNEAVAAGAQDYLVKGQVDGELLARAIRYAVERKRADESLRRLYESELRAEENARLERGLLPLPLTTDPWLTCVTRYRPGRDRALLGGDFYDVVEKSGGTIYAMIGDVAGHGPDEAALGVSLRIAWRTLVLAGLPAARILPTLDEVLIRERRSDEIFATVCMLVIEPGRTSARLYLAGHPPPLSVGQEVVPLPSQHAGPALGLLPGIEWLPDELELRRDWSLFLFTDGLIEGHVGNGSERFGPDRLIELVACCHSENPNPQVWPDLVVAAVEKHNGGAMTDDVAVLLLDRDESPE